MQSVSSRRASSDASWIVLAFFVESAKAFQRGVAAVMRPRRTAILFGQKTGHHRRASMPNASKGHEPYLDREEAVGFKVEGQVAFIRREKAKASLGFQMSWNSAKTYDSN